MSSYVTFFGPLPSYFFLEIRSFNFLALSSIVITCSWCSHNFLSLSWYSSYTVLRLSLMFYMDSLIELTYSEFIPLFWASLMNSFCCQCTFHRSFIAPFWSVILRSLSWILFSSSVMFSLLYEFSSMLYKCLVSPYMYFIF